MACPANPGTPFPRIGETDVRRSQRGGGILTSLLLYPSALIRSDMVSIKAG
jgi:hypothetical protein